MRDQDEQRGGSCTVAAEARVTTGLARAGGHDRRLEFNESVLLGRTIYMRELDLGNDAVLDAILTDIRAARDAGDIVSALRYKGKHPRRWFATLYPEILEPVFLGAFLAGGTLLGWISVVKGMQARERAVAGSIVRAPYRDQGLGSAMLMHLERHLRELPGYGDVAVIAFQTLARNARVHAIARKFRYAGSHRAGGAAPDGGTANVLYESRTTRREGSGGE